MITFLNLLIVFVWASRDILAVILLGIVLCLLIFSRKKPSEETNQDDFGHWL